MHTHAHQAFVAGKDVAGFAGIAGRQGFFGLRTADNFKQGFVPAAGIVDPGGQLQQHGGIAVVAITDGVDQFVVGHFHPRPRMSMKVRRSSQVLGLRGGWQVSTSMGFGSSLGFSGGMILSLS